jgi:hypothetical protein
MVGGEIGLPIKNQKGAGTKYDFYSSRKIGALFILVKIGLAACAPYAYALCIKT